MERGAREPPAGSGGLVSSAGQNQGRAQAVWRAGPAEGASRSLSIGAYGRRVARADGVSCAGPFARFGISLVSTAAWTSGTLPPHRTTDGPTAGARRLARLIGREGGHILPRRLRHSDDFPNPNVIGPYEAAAIGGTPEPTMVDWR